MDSRPDSSLGFHLDIDEDCQAPQPQPQPCSGAMEGFTRLLSPRLRPAMSARTRSGSPNMAGTINNHCNNNNSNSTTTAMCEPLVDLRAAGPKTGGGFSGDGHGDGQDNDTAPRTPGDDRDDHETLPLASSHPTVTRPIAIELPKFKRISTAPAEALSARGDLPGGYFPFHEDPQARLHRPHPFHHEPSTGRNHSADPILEALTETDPPRSTSIADPTMARSDTPVTSYLPSGYHKMPMPMGKYYPSNWDRRHPDHGANAQRPPASQPTTVRSDSHVPTRSATSTPSTTGAESDLRRRLQQYKRDMIAQATLAASEIKASSPASNGGGLRLHDLPTMDARLSAPAVKPVSPRLLPIGSPGPVTPMELESSTGGSYLDKGKGKLKADGVRRTRDGHVAPGVGYTANTT